MQLQVFKMSEAEDRVLCGTRSICTFNSGLESQKTVGSTSEKCISRFTHILQYLEIVGWNVMTGEKAE